MMIMDARRTIGQAVLHARIYFTTERTYVGELLHFISMKSEEISKKETCKKPKMP